MPLRRTRIVCISDTHNVSPKDGVFKLPQGDVLIHAGDLTKQGSFSELAKSIAWIGETGYEAKVVVAGNHDTVLDPSLYPSPGSRFQHEELAQLERCKELFKKYDIVYLEHENVQIKLTHKDGPHTCFSVFGSPYSPAISSEHCAFTYRDQQEARELWSQIPTDTTIFVTHTPPYSHCDLKPGGEHTGCKDLDDAISRRRPRLAICGHVHEGRGYERVLWPTSGEQQAARKIKTTVGIDATLGTKKQFIVDLSARSSHPLLANETCIVNAAIAANSWPFQGGRRFNKPIIIDLDLPSYH